MYTLKLSAEERTTLQLALFTTRRLHEKNPVFAEDLANIEILLQKAKDAEFTPEKAERNDPLTQDELRAMDGEPVWCVSGYGRRQTWGLVNVDDGIPDAIDSNSGFWNGCYYNLDPIQ